MHSLWFVSDPKEARLTLLSPRLATYTMSSTTSTHVAVEPSFHAGFLFRET